MGYNFKERKATVEDIINGNGWNEENSTEEEIKHYEAEKALDYE